ncbi:MFS transporter [Actinocorallia sp. B10E7]|uniref:MFS transporter n=1 Tax=Actinocorallia sp. B10E7 TaxID=3153558 RepID=UPI00325E093D
MIALACAGAFVAYLPVVTVVVSLPAIQRALGASTAQLAWVSDAFVLPVAALILTAGVFGDVHGCKKVYQVGLALTTNTADLDGSCVRRAASVAGFGPGPSPLPIVGISHQDRRSIEMPVQQTDALRLRTRIKTFVISHG